MRKGMVLRKGVCQGREGKLLRREEGRESYGKRKGRREGRFWREKESIAKGVLQDEGGKDSCRGREEAGRKRTIEGGIGGVVKVKGKVVKVEEKVVRERSRIGVRLVGGKLARNGGEVTEGWRESCLTRERKMRREGRKEICRPWEEDYTGKESCVVTGRESRWGKEGKLLLMGERKLPNSRERRRERSREGRIELLEKK